MRFSSLKFVAGGAFLVPVFVLIVWFVSAIPNGCTLYQNLGFVYLAKGTLTSSRAEISTAEDWFSSALRRECQSASVTLGLGQANSRLGRLWQAIAALQDGDERAGLRHFLSGRIDEELGQGEDAWREYRKLPLDAAAHFYKLGSRAEAEGNIEEALHYYSVATAINPNAAKPYYGAAYVYWWHLGDEGGATEMIRRALTVDRTASAERDFYQGLLCHYEGDTGCAVEAWAAALWNPASLDANADPGHLAFEMLSRALNPGRTTTARHFAALFK